MSSPHASIYERLHKNKCFPNMNLVAFCKKMVAVSAAPTCLPGNRSTKTLYFVVFFNLSIFIKLHIHRPVYLLSFKKKKVSFHMFDVCSNSARQPFLKSLCVSAIMPVLRKMSLVLTKWTFNVLNVNCMSSYNRDIDHPSV